MPNSDAPVPPPSRPLPTENKAATVTAEIEVGDRELLMALTGPAANRLALLEKQTGAGVGLRGDVIKLQGAPEAVRLAERVLTELVRSLRQGAVVRDEEFEAGIRVLREHPDQKLDVFQPIAIASGGARQVTPRGLAQKHYVQAIQSHDIVFGVGPAGTGKTYLAVAMAVAALSAQRVKRIVLTRPAVEAGEKLGFLPGDMSEKVDPYLRPLYDALHDMLPAQRVFSLIERGTIEIAPLAFMRGRTLNESFVILDEAQNTSTAQMRMFLTRIGLRSKAVITGDVTQVDLPRGTQSGLSDAVELLAHVDGIRRCTFTSADVVRHPLVQRIVDAYDEREARDKAADEDHR